MTIGTHYFCSKWYTSAHAYDSLTWWRHQQIKKYDTSPLERWEDQFFGTEMFF